MNNYLIETRLKEEDEALHKRVDDCKVVLRHLLDSFQTWFPHFTDHSIMHSTGVLEFCNLILGQQVYSLNLIECYVLAMSCYLHDVGMGVTREHFESFTKEIDLDSYLRRFPDADETRIIRDFHHEFSGKFINKYADLFDIPDEDVRFAIVQVSRGHRKTDLYDEKEYPDMNTSHGVIRTGVLAAVLRIADEIDVGVERNPTLIYDTSSLTDQLDIDAFGTHESIREIEVTEDRIILHVRLKEPRYRELVEILAGKIQKTLEYCAAVAEKRSDIRITQKSVEVVYIS